MRCNQVKRKDRGSGNRMARNAGTRIVYPLASHVLLSFSLSVRLSPIFLAVALARGAGDSCFLPLLRSAAWDRHTRCLRLQEPRAYRVAAARVNLAAHLYHRVGRPPFHPAPGPSHHRRRLVLYARAVPSLLRPRPAPAHPLLHARRGLRLPRPFRRGCACRMPWHLHEQSVRFVIFAR